MFEKLIMITRHVGSSVMVLDPCSLARWLMIWVHAYSSKIHHILMQISLKVNCISFQIKILEFTYWKDVLFENNFNDYFACDYYQFIISIYHLIICLKLIALFIQSAKLSRNSLWNLWNSHFAILWMKLERERFFEYWKFTKTEYCGIQNTVRTVCHF